jgi:maltose alpha-D-glucosyltransferase/alpha-amylase
VRALAERVLGREPRVLARLGAVLGRHLDALRTRTHGALELSRFTYAASDVVIADLDGDAARPVAERRRKTTPLRDVASLMLSLHAVAFATLADPARVRAEDREAARPWADLWWCSAASAMLASYVGAARTGAFLPPDRDELILLLDVFLLKAGFAGLSAALAAGDGVPAALDFLAHLLDEG